MFISILHVKNTKGNVMRLYGIDINPMNPLEFIINGDDEYVRMYDKRRLTTEPVKRFRRVHPSITVSYIIKHFTFTSQMPNNCKQTDDEEDDNITDSRARSPNLNSLNITCAVYNYCGTEILASYSEDDIYLFDVNGLPNTYIRHYSGHVNRMTGNLGHNCIFLLNI